MFHFTHRWACSLSCLLFIVLSLKISNAQVNVSFKLSAHQTVPEDWFGIDGQNTIRNGLSYVDPDVISNIPKTKPQLIRYPSGFSFWDWKRGWFIDSPVLPDRYASLPRESDYLEDFKIILDSCNGADALF